MNIILTGSSGSGLLSAGDIVMEGLQHTGYFVVADREYPSLIKGGCSYSRIEVGVNPIHSISEFADIIVAFDRVGSKNALPHVRNGGLMIYGDEMHDKIPGYTATIQEKKLTTLFIPEYATPKKFGANELLSNMLMIGALWRALGLPVDGLVKAVEKRFASKPALLALDIALIQHGYDLQDATVSNSLEPFSLPETTNNLTEHKLLDGNEVLALSAVHHGVRAYFAYPMSPSSTILSHLANWADKTGMHVEQVEDEISVSQMTLGASFAGTRSLCATSGGGFDLMTETVSLAGMIETPLTIIVAQRPGPATGLPTWSGQEDLNLAIYSGHGEYAKAVIAVGDHTEAFTVLGEALNIAETYQIPVIVLTDKTLAETNATVNPASLVGVEIERGITIDTAELTSQSRYGLTDSGLSPRWLPGTGPRYYANGDEHGPDGTLREDAAGVAEAHEKRVRKMKLLEDMTREPGLYGNPNAKITLVGFGSTKMEVMDFLGDTVNYLHYTNIWPLKTKTIKELEKKGNKIIVVEHNMTGQFAALLKGAGVHVDDTWLKYDGRRFYREEMEAKIKKLITTRKSKLLSFLFGKTK
ncbi:2-oxoacid:acceptor oxidoreductase subunit alpha [Candidatus Gracilibacteria bacterium]|nr:2-oxoacid:acceptor oxidoreductase subunit alpha [Candidatus Gracilibacteria bacterium]